jgi:hypothetical protein
VSEAHGTFVPERARIGFGIWTMRTAARLLSRDCPIGLTSRERVFDAGGPLENKGPTRRWRTHPAVDPTGASAPCTFSRVVVEEGAARLKLSIRVVGVQPSTKRSGPTKWRLAIADAVAASFHDAPYQPSAGVTFAVDIVFRLVKNRLFIQPNQPVPPDLDNLLKPVLDTLFTSDNVVGPTGTLIQRNDTWITEVRARKTEALGPNGEGADITVEWND